MRVLVLDGEQRSALAVTRSLGRAGHEVFVGAASVSCLAGVSKHAKRTLVLPDPSEDATAFAGAVVEACVRFNIELLQPVTDASCFALADAALPAQVKCFQPDAETIRRVADKNAMTALAAELGVAVPKSVPLADAHASLDALSFPVALKPKRSRVEQDGKLVNLAVKFATDPDEAWAYLSELPEGGFPVMAQEVLPGEGVGYFALCRDGEILAEFAHHRLRELPPSGGVSVLSESIALTDDVRDAGRRLLAKVRWTGPAMVEFKRAADGTPTLMEINGRFWGSLQLAIDSGVDFPVLAAKAAMGEAFKAPRYQAGVRLWSMLGDLEAFLVVVKRGKAALNPVSNCRKAYFRNWLLRRGRPELLRLSDPRPFFKDASRMWSKAVRLFVKKSKRPVTRGVVHAHTTFSYDGTLTPEALAAHLEERGLSFVALAEHVESMDADAIARLWQVCERISRPGMIVIPGIEFSTFINTHILGLGVREFFDEKDPARIVAGIKKRGGVAVLAHPDIRPFERDEQFLSTLDGVEIWNSTHDGPFVPSLLNIAAVNEIRGHNPKVKAFGGCDFHKTGDYRGAHVELTGRLTTRDDILDALRHGHFATSGKFFHIPATSTVGPLGRLAIRAFRVANAAVLPVVHRLRRVRRRGLGPVYRRHWNGEHPIRVMHTIETSNPGGAERMMMAVVDSLKHNDYESRILLIKDGWLSEQFRARDLPMDVVRLRALGDIRFILKMARICRNADIDIVHSHEMYMNFHGAIASRLAGVGHIAVVHGNIDFLRAWQRKLAYRLALMAGTTFVAVSYATRDELAQVIGVSPRRIRVIHNGVSIPVEADERRRDDARRALDVGDRPTVALIGSLYTVKGHEILLAGLSRLQKRVPDVAVLFIGRGKPGDQERLEAIAKPFGDAVRFLGFRDDVERLLPGIDVLAVPSLMEGLSLSLCEAMAAGVPAVASRVGGNPEVITDGHDGYLFPVGDSAAFADRVADLLTDPAHRKKIAAAARRTAIERFSNEAMMHAYQQLYVEVITRA
ncbi:MAG: ATP-grasp domain-containing protein [Deltaproteobacteria bacterium]|nr:ATP-grasp domain-containing protein [Deltaproteobacteria bacterium]